MDFMSWMSIWDLFCDHSNLHPHILPQLSSPLEGNRETRDHHKAICGPLSMQLQYTEAARSVVVATIGGAMVATIGEGERNVLIVWRSWSGGLFGGRAAVPPRSGGADVGLSAGQVRLVQAGTSAHVTLTDLPQTATMCVPGAQLKFVAKEPEGASPNTPMHEFKDTDMTDEPAAV